MEQILSKPHKVLWWSIPLCLIVSILATDSFIEIQMHDTYYVIAAFHLGLFFSLVLSILGVGYWLVRSKRLNIWMTATHVISTLLLFLALLFESFIFRKILTLQIGLFIWFNKLFALITVLFFVSQLIFLVNTVISMSRK